MRTGKRMAMSDALMATLIFVPLFFTATPLSATEKQPTIGSYTVPNGDSLWKIAGRAYRGHADWKKVGWIVKANANLITNPRYIKAGWKIVIPPAPSQSHNAAKSTVVVPAAATTATIATPTVVASAQLVPAPAVASRITLSATKAMPEPAAALALPDSPTPLPKVLCNPTPHVLLTNTTGHRVVLPVQVAKQSGIPLKGNFDSQIFLYESEREKSQGQFSGVMFHINTRAETKGGETTLSFALRTLPTKPFTIIIAGNSVDGADFVKGARPFNEKFPGPRSFTRTIRVMGRVMIPYTVVSAATVNPIPFFIGIGHAVIPTVTSALLRRSADRTEARAEAQLQKTLAENKKLLDAPLPTEPSVASAPPSTNTIDGGLE
jgi:LysM repeat protein